MKRYLKVCVGMVALGVSFSAWSAAGGDHPCKAIAEACKSAGFVKEKAPGNNIFKDCLKPILAGQQVKSISVSPDEIAACKAKMQEHEGGQGHGPGPAPQAPQGQ